METYKMQIELTEEEVTALNGVVLAAVMACVKHDDLDLAGLLSKIGLKLHAAKDAAMNK